MHLGRDVHEGFMMRLPKEILKKINLKVSRHKEPSKLDWVKRNEKWEALENGRTFVLIHDDKFGYVIAETKTACAKTDSEVDG